MVTLQGLSKCRKVSEEKSVGLLSIYTKQCDKSDPFIFKGHIALHLIYDEG
jgi:hypothetical protein